MDKFIIIRYEHGAVCVCVCVYIAFIRLNAALTVK